MEQNTTFKTKINFYFRLIVTLLSSTHTYIHYKTFIYTYINLTCTRVPKYNT